jgi:8-oxo-dGTP pyrophosphatase MutT (NUDIX family)
MAAALRELEEETGLTVPPGSCRQLDPRYVPDSRASDEAWNVTVPLIVDLGTVDVMPDVAGGDDARRAEWVAAGSYAVLTRSLADRFDGQVFAAHTRMLRDILDD